MQTQSALANHADKVKTLESVIAEHEHVKHELTLMRELMDQRKVEMETLVGHSQLRVNGDHDNNIHDTEHDAEEDRRSILTALPEDAEPGRVSAIHSNYSRDDRDRYEEEEDRARSEAISRPRTPEPHGMGIGEDDDEEADASHRLARRFNSSTLMSPTSNFDDQRYALSLQPSSNLAIDVPTTTAEELHSQNAILSTRLETLAQQLDTALNLSRTLHSQAEAAQHNIELLEVKVKSLEAFVENTKSQQAQQEKEKDAAVNRVGAESGAALPKQQLVLTEVWESWRQRVEGQWRTEREEWDAERLRLQEAVRDWEARVAEIEERDQLRNVQGNELLGALRHERDEAVVVWKMPRHGTGDSHSSDEAAENQSHTINGTTSKVATKMRRSTPFGSSPKAAGKLRKRRLSPSRPVSTPPHSPPMNSDTIIERSSDASGSRSASPEPANKGSVADAFSNGHIKPELLPLSPAPSVRHGGTRANSTSSDLDPGDDLNITPSIGHLAPPSPNPSRSRGGPWPLKENVSLIFRHVLVVRLSISLQPMPYISASVVLIGLAAWAFTSRAKE
jgi:hypothetical protein